MALPAQQIPTSGAPPVEGGVSALPVQSSDKGTASPTFGSTSSNPSSPQAPDPISAVPASEGVIVSKEDFQADSNFEHFEMYTWRSVKRPSGVLVLVDEKARIDIFLDDRWVKFARTQRWSVIVLGLKVKGAPPSPDPAISSLGQKVFSWVDLQQKIGADTEEDQEAESPNADEPIAKGPLPIIFQATGSAAFWMESLMLQKPARFAAWLALHPSKFPEAPRDKGFLPAPGGFVAVGIKKFGDQIDHFEELRSRNAAGRVSFVIWDEKSPQTLLDAFSRMYLADTVQSSDEEHLWLNVHSLRPHPMDALNKPDPVRFGWFPSQQVLQAAQTLRPSVLPTPPPSQSRKFFKVGGFTSCDLRWIKNVPKPKAVLLIANSTLPANIRHMPEWIDFAKKREWAVLLMGLKEDKIRSLETAAKNLETRLYKDIDSFAGPELKNLPLITYAQGVPAMWLQTLMLRQPSRYRLWINTSTTRFPSVTTSIKTPAGLLIAQNGREYVPCLHHFEDLRSSDPYNPVSFLPLADIRPPVPVLEATYRHFMDAALNPASKKESWRWLHLHDLTPPTSSVISKPDPRHYAWFPRSDIVGMWKALRQETFAAPLPIIAKRSFKTKIPEVPELKLFVRIPGSLKKGEVPSGVLCFCTWQQEDTTLINRLKSTEDSLVTFADRRGMAMITWNTASMLPAGTKVFNLTEEQEADIQRRFTAFGEEWRSAIRKVCNEFKLQDKDMLLHGVSRGASFAHQISMRYPQQFLAVHTHIGSHYNEILPKEAKDTFWLVTTGEADGGYGDSFKLYTKLKELGAPVLFKAGESLGHSTRRDIEELGAAFFTHALNLRSRCEQEKAKDRNFKDTPQSLYLASQIAAPWFGDYINHQAFQANDPELETIPPDQRLPLPTEPIAKAWRMSLEEATAKKETLKNFAVGN